MAAADLGAPRLTASSSPPPPIDAHAEIATHTLTHASLVPGAVNITYQIDAQRRWLHEACGIPLDKMRASRGCARGAARRPRPPAAVPACLLARGAHPSPSPLHALPPPLPVPTLQGFRAPYLLHNKEVRQALAALGYQYDASILESWPSASSPSSASRLWPYSMAAGIAQSCQWMAPSSCAPTERYPLWEVPLQQFATGPGESGGQARCREEPGHARHAAPPLTLSPPPLPTSLPTPCCPHSHQRQVCRPQLHGALRGPVGAGGTVLRGLDHHLPTLPPLLAVRPAPSWELTPCPALPCCSPSPCRIPPPPPRRRLSSR